MAQTSEPVTLEYPRIRYAGEPDLEYPMVHWSATVSMSEWSAGEPHRSVEVCRLQLTAVDIWGGQLAEALDSVSGDTAEFIKLMSDSANISEKVRDQFELVNALLILDEAYVEPALRGHDLGVWAAAHAIRDLTMLGSGVFVVTHPSPTERRPDVAAKTAKASLVKHWHKVGLRRIKACPHLMGQDTAGMILDNAFAELPDDISITVPTLDGLVIE